MFKFREIKEIKSDETRKKEKEVLPYMTIKPSSDFSMTDDEVKDFWNTVFSEN